MQTSLRMAEIGQIAEEDMGDPQAPVWPSPPATEPSSGYDNPGFIRDAPSGNPGRQFDDIAKPPPYSLAPPVSRGPAPRERGVQGPARPYLVLTSAPGPNGRRVLRAGNAPISSVIRTTQGTNDPMPPVITTAEGSDTSVLVTVVRQRRVVVTRTAVRAVFAVFLLIIAIIGIIVTVTLKNQSSSSDDSSGSSGDSGFGDGTHDTYTPRPVATAGDDDVFYASFLLQHAWRSDMTNIHSSSFRRMDSTLSALIDGIYHRSTLNDKLLPTKLSQLKNHDGRTLLAVVKLTAKGHSSSYYTWYTETRVTSYNLKTAFKQAYQAYLSDGSVPLSQREIAVEIVSDTYRVFDSQSAAASTTHPGGSFYPPGRECGEIRALPEVRIVGGRETEKGVFPWMAMLLYKGEFLCGGSILDERHILTAGHCVLKSRYAVSADYSRYSVVVGKHHIDTSTHYPGEQEVLVLTGYRHDSFNESGGRLLNDIAVFRLAEPLHFNSRVSPICLPSFGDQLPERCVIAGWGALHHENQQQPTSLRSATLWAYNSSQCMHKFPNVKHDGHSVDYFLSPTVMCAANSTFGGQDTCQGDSGGPLFCLQEGSQNRYTQFGIVSYGYGCADPGSPGFYTYLPAFVYWLHTVALPKLNRTVTSNSYVCHSLSPLTDYRTSECRSQIRQLSYYYCRNITQAVRCVGEALAKVDFHCNLDDVYNAIVQDYTGSLKQQCSAKYSGQASASCESLLSSYNAVQTCSRNTDCLSMLELKLCVHHTVDPDWLSCSQKQIQDYLDSNSHHYNICQDHTVRTLEDGRHFMYVRGNWYAVCGNSWDHREVKVVCKQRGFSKGNASLILRTNETIYASDDPIGHPIKASGWMKVTCSGSESSLAHCQLKKQLTCPTSYVAASVCYNTVYRFTLDKAQPNSNYGYVQLSRDEGRGHVCVSDLSDRAAHFLCREAGYVAGMALRNSLPPPSSTHVWETEMTCDAGAVDVNGCAEETWTLHNQKPSSCTLAKVFCFSSKVRFHNGLFNSSGVVQMYRPTPNGRDVTLKTVCRERFNNFTANIVCHDNGFPLGGYSLSFNPFFKPTNNYVRVQCNSGARKLSDCSVTDNSLQGCREPAVVRCFVQNPSTEPDLKVQVHNNEVQVFLDGQLGTICPDHWTDNEASAICKDLGHLYGYRTFPESLGKNRTLPHVLRNLKCAANVTSLSQCSFQPVSTDQCQHSVPAAVLCSHRPYPVFTLQTTYSTFQRHIVLMHYNGTSAPLSASTVSNATVHALCRSMGYVTGEWRNQYSSHSSMWRVYFQDSCTKTKDIRQCMSTTPQNISCSSSYCRTISAYCYSAPARLHTGVSSTVGIVQLYREGKWWQVCGDDVTQSSGDVICREVMNSSSASAIVLRDVYSLGSFPRMVRARGNCDSNDRGSRSATCMSLDLTSQCESFNSNPAAVVCYTGAKPSAGITGWKSETPSSWLSSSVASRVWVKRYGVWGTVCDDKWYRAESVQLCKHTYYQTGTFGSGMKRNPDVPMWVWSVNCTLRYSIDSCRVQLSSDTEGSCQSNNDATVICS